MIQAQIRKHALESAVLILQFLEPLQLLIMHSPVLFVQGEKCRAVDFLLTTDVLGPLAGLMLWVC